MASFYFYLQLANKDTVDESGSCLKLEMVDIVVCQWDDCGAAFHSVKLLSDHVQSHIKSQLGWYACLWKNCPRREEEFGARSVCKILLRYICMVFCYYRSICLFYLIHTALMVKYP